MTLTHSAGALAFAGGTVTFTGGAITPATNDAAALGTTTLGWSDLHLATGGVINWANGEITLTETDANTLTFAGGIFALPASGFSINGTTVTTTGAQLNYLNAATGTTGTTSTNIVFSTSPTLVTPTLGVASATSINKVSITAPATSATLTISDGKTLTISNSLTLAGTDSTTMTFPAASTTVAGLGTTQTFKGANTFNVARTIASGASAVLQDIYVQAATTTISGVTNITTATGFNKIEIGIPTMSAASALTISNSATVYIAGAPAGGGAGPATITNAYSIWIDAGTSRFDSTVLFGATVTPQANDGAALGTTSLMFSDLFLASGGVINFNNGNATITHAAGSLTSNVPVTANSFVPSSSTAPSDGIYLPAANTIGFAISSTGEVQITASATSPVTSDGNALGTSSLMWSDLFLASGAVVNFNNGDVTLTHASNLLTLAGGQFTFGANTAYFTETDNGNSSTADTIDWTLSNKQKSTLTDNCTFTFTAPGGPASLILKLVQDGTGSRTVTWPAEVHWSGGTAPTLTTTASKVDIICFYYDGSTYFGTSSLNYTA